MFDHPGTGKFRFDLIFLGTIEYWCDCLETELSCCPAQMCLQYLSKVHTSGDTCRVKDNIDRGSVIQVRHIFYWDDHGYDTFIPVPTGHLITSSDLTFLGNRYPDHRLHTGGQICILFAGKDFHINNFSTFSVGHPQRGVFYIPGFLAEDRPQESFFGGQLFFTFR